jgi:hypothetical protein
MNAGSLERDICRLTARAALTCLVRESPNSRPARHGVPRNPGCLSTLRSARGTLRFLGSLVRPLVVVASNPSGWKEWEKILWGVGIAALSSLAVLIALWFRQLQFVRHPDSGRPMTRYLTSSIVAIGGSFVLIWGLHLIDTRSLALCADRQAITWPWSLLAGMTALVTRLLVDSRPKGFLAVGQRGRVVDACVFAVAATISVGVVHYFLNNICVSVSSAGLDTKCQSTFVPLMKLLLLGAGGAGALIGWCVPTWVREADEQSVGEREPRGMASPQRTRYACDPAFTRL